MEPSWQMEYQVSPELNFYDVKETFLLTCVIICELVSGFDSDWPWSLVHGESEWRNGIRVDVSGVHSYPVKIEGNLL